MTATVSVVDSKNLTYRRPNLPKYLDLQDPATGLHQQGQAAFTQRLNEILRENGWGSGNLSLGRDGAGKLMILDDHPEREKIENLLNTDEQLIAIRENPDNRFDLEKGGVFMTNFRDTAEFTAEALALYAQSQNNSPFTSSAEDFGRVLKWQADTNSWRTVHAAGDHENHSIAELYGAINYGVAAGDVPDSPSRIINAAALRESTNARQWLETEIAAILKKNDLDPAALKNLKIGTTAVDNESGGRKFEIVVYPDNEIPRETAKKIEQALNQPQNEKLIGIFATYQGNAVGIATALKAATGISDRDWQMLLVEQGNSAALEKNAGMSQLLASDPELKNALINWLQPDGLLLHTQDESALAQVERTTRGLTESLDGMLAINRFTGRNALGMNAAEAAEAQKTLRITADPDGNVSVSGARSEKVKSALETTVRGYLAGGHAAGFAQAKQLYDTLFQLDGNRRSLNFNITFAGRQAALTWA